MKDKRAVVVAFERGGKSSVSFFVGSFELLQLKIRKIEGSLSLTRIKITIARYSETSIAKKERSLLVEIALS